MSSILADNIRGFQSEAKAKEVLHELWKEKAILSYRRTDRGSKDDLCGIDFYFSILLKGRRIEVPLQVKSSWAGIKDHYSKEQKRDIYAVNAQAPDLKNQIIAIIKDYKAAFEEEKPMAVAEKEIKIAAKPKTAVVLPSQDHRVHVEYNYNKFKFTDENRDIKQANLDKLAKSIKRVDMSDYFPVLVNEKMEILDGQHRFTVWKSLGMPIKYKMIKRADKEIIADINTAQATWGINDFIKNQAALGNLNFVLLREDMKKHKITAMTLLSAILGIKSYNDLVRNKTIVYRKQESNEVAMFMHDVQMFRDFSFGKMTRFYQAFAMFRQHPAYDHATMERQVKRWGHAHLNPQSNHMGYLRDLAAVYNYNRPKDKHISDRDFE